MTLILVAITAIISFLSFSNEKLRNQLILNPYVIHVRKEYWRFITSGFIHADVTHLIFNMIVLWSFGSYVESRFEYLFQPAGKIYFVVFYLMALAISSMRTFNKHKNNPGYNALGASGATSSILFASAILNPMNGIYIYFIPIPIPAIVFCVIYLIYESYMAKKAMDNIGHDVHFDGAIFGIAFMFLNKPSLISEFWAQLPF